MIPVQCMVKHDPENGKYGDCLRACVASLLELPSENVPHFLYDGCEPEETYDRLRDWLFDEYKFRPFFTGYDASMEAEAVMQFMANVNPDIHYLLFAKGHVVVCLNDKIAHDPAWSREPLVRPDVSWTVMVLALC